ncbi:MAG: hypothetical protein IIC92_08775 [Chloroflexi bacterium]|nr:hypothetical protein [Chloroflexota bacterium]
MWKYPRLTNANHRVTSDASEEYNCVAWAAGIDTENVWPGDYGDDFVWSEDLPEAEEMASVVAFFESLGYEVCETTDLEEGFEKVALYSDDEGDPTHVALQLRSGAWTSKLGWLEDIAHDSPELVGGGIGEWDYGNVTVVMRRFREPEREQLPLIPVEEFEGVMRSVFNAPKEDVDEEIATMQAANRQRREERSQADEGAPPN